MKRQSSCFAVLAPGPRRTTHEIELANEACAGKADSHMHLQRDPVFHPDLVILVLEHELGRLTAGQSVLHGVQFPDWPSNQRAWRQSRRRRRARWSSTHRL